MRAVVVSTLVAVAAVGCTAEMPEQQAARELVEVHVAGRAPYDGHVRCTRNPRPWFVQRTATVYVCAARREDDDCDWFRVTVGEGSPRVTLDRERGGCVLPV